jgi:hypothetical protein
MGMRISSNAGASEAGAAAWQQRQQSFQALSQALGSNNLDAAKAAYTSLTGNGSNSATSNPNSPFAQLGKALQDGDLSGAQQAFASIRSAHHRSANSSSGMTAGLATSQPSAATATMGNNVNVLV